VRLDHLLSREYQVEVIGEISASLAPRLIVAVGSVLSSGESGAGLRAGEIEDDLAKTPIPLLGAGIPVTLQGLGCPAWRPTVARRHRQAGD
jgi:hypothetical protein